MTTTTIVQQPQPNDIVGSRVLIAGLATGVEATVRARVRDGNGVELASTFFMCGAGCGEIGQFQTEIELPNRPATPSGFVEVFEDNLAYPDEGPYGAVSEINKLVVPVVFGSHLVETYCGYTHHVVVDGETLSGIASEEYGDGAEWPAIFEANRDQIGDPALIYDGQRLRIPHHVSTATTTVDVHFLNTEHYAAGTEPYTEAVARTVAAAAPATGALVALFNGPTPSEQGRHLALTRSEATGFADLSIESGIARVRLVGGCNSQGATFTIANLIAMTLRQFSTVDYVKIYDPDGATASPGGPTDSIPDCLNP